MRLLCRETQELQAGLALVLPLDQLDNFLWMIQRILPALQAGTDETLGASGMSVQLLFTGKQQVAIKIQAVALRVDNIDRNTALAEIKRLIIDTARK